MAQKKSSKRIFIAIFIIILGFSIPFFVNFLIPECAWFDIFCKLSPTRAGMKTFAVIAQVVTILAGIISLWRNIVKDKVIG